MWISRGKKWFEDAGQYLQGNAFTGIFDLNHDAGLFMVEGFMRRDVYGRSVHGGGINRVVDDVQEHLLDLISIGMQMVSRRGERRSDFQMFRLQRSTQQFEDLGDEVRQHESSQRELARPRILNNLIHDPIHSSGLV